MKTTNPTEISEPTKVSETIPDVGEWIEHADRNGHTVRSECIAHVAQHDRIFGFVRHDGEQMWFGFDEWQRIG